jgi:hypothetical protein
MHRYTHSLNTSCCRQQEQNKFKETKPCAFSELNPWVAKTRQRLVAFVPTRKHARGILWQSPSRANAFEVAHLVIRDSPFSGFSCSYSCSVDDGARDQFRSFEYDNEHHFIEYEHDFLSRSSNSATSKLTLRAVIQSFALRQVPKINKLSRVLEHPTKSPKVLTTFATSQTTFLALKTL